jgi:hypothetical protein
MKILEEIEEKAVYMETEVQILKNKPFILMILQKALIT